MIDSISNDSINEDFIIMTIIESDIDYFRVILSLPISEIYKESWIKKTRHIGTYARNYGEREKLNLYSKPDKNSKIESIVETWIPELYTVIDCNCGWVKVKLEYGGKLYKGWLEKDMQCPNPYTTCN